MKKRKLSARMKHEMRETPAEERVEQRALAKYKRKKATKKRKAKR